MKKAIICLAKNRCHAHVILRDLLRIGFENNEISVLLPDERFGNHPMGYEKHTKALSCAAAGSLVGSLMGCFYGLIEGMGIFALSFSASLSAIGPAYAALSCSAIVGSVGLILGSLVGLNIPEYVVCCYESSLHEGRPLLSIHVDNPYDEKKAIESLEKTGAEDIAATPEEVFVDK